MKWNLSLLRRFFKPTRQRTIRNRHHTRLRLESLETRLAPANVPILSGHYDNLLTGWNSQETTLTPANVNDASFGKLFSDAIDGYAYAQPLYVPQVNIPGQGTHDVVFVATEHDSLYAFDANAAGPALWQRSFIDPANGITTLSAPADVNTGDIVPEVGITGTPVIDPATNTLYVIAKTKEARTDGTHFVQKLFAIDITSGANRVSPLTIGDTKLGGTDGGYTNVTSLVTPGTGAGSDGTNVRFNALRQMNRMALQLVTNTDSSKTVYAGWASHGDNGPYHGWIVGFNASTLAIQKWFDTSPNGSAGAPWESGGNFAVDAQGNLYFANGNGFTVGPIQGFDANGGPRALGASGGALGYGSGTGLTPAGITNSAAITFRAYDHSSTGLTTNGSPTEATSNNLTGTGIDFNAGAQAATKHVFQVTLTYSGTTLTETLKDLTTNSTTVTETYTNVNIQSLVGGNTAYVGFTGGTGGLNMQQDVQTWTYTPSTGTPINHSAGFASNGDMLSNGSAAFTGTVARLTTAGNGEAGSVFSTSQVDITGFSTTFTFQMSAGSNPVADGMTFTIQNKPAGLEYAESVLKLSTQSAGTSLPVVDFFTPNDWKNLDNGDTDLGSGGTMLLPDAVSGGMHLLVETGKSGRMYLINRDHMGENVPTGNNDQILQTITIGGPGVWGNAAFLQDGVNTGLIYYWGTSAPGQAWRVTNGVINPTPVSRTTFNIAFPGSQPSISSNGQNGASAVMWAIRGDNYGSNGPESLLAFNAENLAQQLWSSTDVTGRDAIGGTSVKFTFPIETNGHVYAASNGTLAVYGLLQAHTVAPDARTSLAATGLNDTQIKLTWTNPTATAANGATLIKIERSSTSATTGFSQIALIGADQTMFTDTGLAPVTHYWYRIRATNQIGDSPYSNTADAFTRLAASTLSATAVTSTEVDLSWTRVANGDHYTLFRATDGGAFVQIASISNASTTTYADLTVSQGHSYQYQLHTFSVTPNPDESISNVVSAVIKGVDIEFPFPDGITSSDGLQFNGSAIYSATEQLIRLNNDFSQAGSVFTTAKVSDTKFSSTFWIRLHEGTQPNPADGLTFTIQANSPTALGGGGGALGYQGIGKSVAIKFDVYDNSGETNNSTGLFFNGDMPDLPHQAGEVNVPLGDPNNPNTPVNLRDQHRKRIDISYDASTLLLTVTITDEQHANGPTSVTQTYNVNIPAIIGQDAAYVGFTGGTGGLFSLQDVTGWVFTPTPPAGPSNLTATGTGPTSVTLNWTSNSTNEAGFSIERSTDNYHFTEIGTVGIGVRTFQDTAANGLVANTIYFYRVRAFNDNGNSGYSNLAQVTLGGTIVSIDHSNGFEINDDLKANGNTTFVSPSTVAAKTLQQLDDGTSENGSWNNSEGTETEDNWIANSFQVTAGSEIITSLSFKLGQNETNRPVTVLIYTGTSLTNPHAGTGLTRVSTTDATITGTSGSFVTLPLNSPLTLPVGQVYWAALLLRNVGGNEFPYTIDTDSPKGRSWFDVGPTQGGAFNVDNTNNATVFGGTHPVVHSGVQDAGNLMLRVNTASLPQAPLGIFTAHTDIGTAGDPSPAGNATFDSTTGKYTLTASGSDIWDTTDHMQYLYKPMNGDGEIVARVASLNNTDYWSKTGIMIRETTATGSKNAFSLETGPNDIGGAGPHNEPIFQWRTDTNGGSADNRGQGTFTQAAPIWLRLVRSGNTFSGYWAVDINNGQSHGSWQSLGNTHDVAMNASVLVGLGLTAHNNGTTATATFDHVNVVTAARLTDAVNNQDSSLFTTQKVPISGSFSTSWVMNMRPGSGAADGLTFTIQNDAAGAGALGSGGGGLGYSTDTVGGPQGIHPSVMVKFDMYSQGSHHATTGLYINGESPNITSKQVDMTAAGINFSQNHTYQVTLASDGITLTETVKDLVSGATFSTSYAIDIAGTIGSSTAYVGFTGGTGGENAWVAIESWTANFNSLTAPPHLEVHYATTTSGAPVVFTVAEKTSNGQPVANYRGTIHFSSSDPQAILPGDYTFTASDAGTHTFAGVLFHVGTDTITITDNSPTPFTDTLSVLVNPTTFVVSGFPSEVTAGDSHNFTVTALDYFGNTATDYQGTIHFTSSDPHAVLPPDTSLGGGTGTFSGTLVTAGTQSITVVDPLTPSNSRGTEDGILVDPAAVTTFIVSGYPSSTTAGDAHNFTVTAQDAYGNIATNYTGTVTFSSNDPNAGLPADATLTNGVGTFSATLVTAGTRSITVTDTASGVTGTKDGILVTPGAAVGFIVRILEDPITAGNSDMIFVTAVDAYGNEGAVYTGTVHFSSSDGAATLPADYRFTAGDNGSHLFSGIVFRTHGHQSVFVTDTLDPTITGSGDVDVV